MLIKATKEDIAIYSELAYRLAMNPATSSYPTYTDDIKTKAEFLAAAERAVAEETAELMLFVKDGRVEGWLSYFWLPEDQYLQLDGCSIRCGTQQALEELLARLTAKFPAYTACFGFPGENRAAIETLAAHGYRCVEQSWNHSFFFDGYRSSGYAPCVERISRQNFDRFRAVYHADPDTYWTLERIFEVLDDWTIFVYNRADTPIAAIFLTGRDGYFEIFGTAVADGAVQPEVLRALLCASLTACKQSGAKYLTYLCPEREKDVLRELDFHCVGQYICMMNP